MSSIPMSLESSSSQFSEVVEERLSLPSENSSLDGEELSTRVIERIEDVLSDQNEFEEIENNPGLTPDELCEKSLNYPERSLNHSEFKGRKYLRKKSKSPEHSLHFLGKILFFIFILCVLIGIFAAFVEQSLKNSDEIPDEEDDVDEKSLTRLFNNRKNNFNTKEMRTNQEVNVESLKKSVQISGKLIKEKNLNNEAYEKNKSSESSSTNIEKTEKTHTFEAIKQNIEKSISEFKENEMNKKENIEILSTNQSDKKENKIISSIEKNVEENNKINTKEIQEISQNKTESQENENKLTSEIKSDENKQVSSIVQNGVQPEKNDLAEVLSLVYPPGNTIPEPQCSKYILEQRTKYGGLYQFSVNRNVFRSNSNVNYFLERVPTKITKEKYVEAVDLLEVLHNIDPNGNIIAQDTPCESGEKVSTRIQEKIQKQTYRLNKEYQMDSYFNNQLRFCIVVNSYNNAHNGLIYRNIDSILQQNYTNYHVVYTDDNSPDQTGEMVQKYLKEKSISEGKFKIKINQEKVGMMENIYNAITYDCQEGEIAVMLDGDDSFIGTNVLSLLNALYQKKKVALLWNNFLQINENSRAMMGFSRDLDDFKNNFKSYRITHRFVSSHLKSFFVDLFRKIKKEDLQENNGKFYGGASDTAIMMPMLEMAFPRIEYVPEIVYEYRFDTGQVGMTVNRLPQAVALTKIGLTEPYKSLKNFSFIDDAINKVQSQNEEIEKESKNLN